MLRILSNAGFSHCCHCQTTIYGRVFYHRTYVSFVSQPLYDRKRPTTSSSSHDHRKLPQRTTARTTYPRPVEIPTVKKTVDDFVKPIILKITNDQDAVDVGKELAGSLDKSAIRAPLDQFAKRPGIRKLCSDSGISEKLFNPAFISFRKFCLESAPLPAELHVLFSNIAKGVDHVDSLFPYFMAHARKVYPHIEFLKDLQSVSDLTQPQMWYEQARNITRKFIYHAGPTNSGKTFQALERFMAAKSGVYCGPLKLLASEVFHKTNNAGIDCDLITGEERKYVKSREDPSKHSAITIEMLNTEMPYEVAVIDEIQMLRDKQRGWAWTRALLGVCAEEVHLCGEYAAVQFVTDLLGPMAESVEVRKYSRMTPLTILNDPLGSFDNVRPGDCIVAFNKNDIYNISRQIERKGHEVAVIYGSLPPGTKLAQAQKFNDPKASCKVMVATDAIGMGLNLSIKRIIFWTLMKPQLTETAEKVVEALSASQALQIAGRAGRFNTQYANGEVTTFNREDLPKLRQILSSEIVDITKAGLYPTYTQIETFAYFLPNATLSNLVDIFYSLCAFDNSKYFMCNMDDFKALSEMIEYITSLSLKARYVFCLAPINRNSPFVCSQFVRFARKFASGEPLTFDWLSSNLGWPFVKPENLVDLVHLEGVFDVMEMYLWLGYRFPDMFPDMELVREMQKEADNIIREAVLSITQLLRNSESTWSSRVNQADADHEEFNMRQQRDRFLKHGLSKDNNVAGKVVEPIAGPDSNDKTSTTGVGVVIEMPTLMKRLIEQGMLTQKMAEQLKLEIYKEAKLELDANKQHDVSKHDPSKHKKKKT